MANTTKNPTKSPVAPAPAAEKVGPWVWIAMTVSLLLWASAFPGVREGLALAGETPGVDGYGAGELALLRFGTASLALLIWALATRMRLPERADVPRIALAGVFGFFGYHVLFNFGERVVESAASAVLIGLAPIFTAVLATIFLGERLNLFGWLGIGVSFSGAALVALGQGATASTFEPATALLLVAAFSTSMYFFIGKPVLAKYSSVEFTTWAIWAGTLPMLIFAPSLIHQMQTVPPTATVAGVYLGIFPGAIAYVLWSIGLSRMTASRTAAFLYLQPLNAAIIAYFWGEPWPELLVIVGGLVAIGGVIIVNTVGKPKLNVAAVGEHDGLDEMLEETAEAALEQA